MLSHHLGTKTFQGDFTFCNSSLTRQQIINKMQLLKPSQNFRQSYGYCNSCFLTAGERMQYIRDNKVESVDIKVNDYIEFDPYTFTKE